MGMTPEIKKRSKFYRSVSFRKESLDNCFKEFSVIMLRVTCLDVCVVLYFHILM